MIRRPPRSTPFPYTTHFRSEQALAALKTLGEAESAVHHIPFEQVHFHEIRSEEHTSELQSQSNLVCRLLLEKKKKNCSSINITLYNRALYSINLSAENQF